MDENRYHKVTGKQTASSERESSWRMFKYLIGLLDEKGKGTLRICAIFFFFSPIVDLLSVSMVIPVLRRAAEQMVLERLILQFSGLGVIFLARGGFELLKIRISNGFMRDSAAAWSVKIYELYSKEELLEHSQKTAIQQLTGVRTDTEACAGIMVSYMGIVVHAIVLLGYCALSAYAANLIGIAIFALIMALLFFLFARFRSRIMQFGAEKRKREIKISALITTAYGAYKEMKMDSRAKYMLEKYEQSVTEYARVQKDYALVAESMGVILQNAVQAVMFFLLPVILAVGMDLTSFLTEIVVCITILTNLLPRAASMILELSRIQYWRKNYDVFHENMERYGRLKLREKQLEEIREKQVTFTRGLRVENLTFHYPGGEDILRNASIEIPAGRTVAIVGSSGVGKTTFLDLVLGLLTPQSGHIWYDDYELVEGRDADGPCKGELGSIVSYIPQVVYLNGETIRNNVVFLEKGEGEPERIISCLKKAQIWEDVEAFPDGLDTLIGENGTALSGGQRQRVALARAMYKEFELLIMDEATAALDAETEKAVMDALCHMEGKKTLLIVTHHLALAEDCESIYKIEDKKFKRIR